MKLSKVNNSNFCMTPNVTTFDNCDWVPYIESISLQGILPIFLGIIAFPFAFVTVWIIRLCCCHANKPSKGLCCGDTKDWDAKKDGYTNSESTMIVMLLVIAAVIFIAFMSYAIVSDDEMSGHISDFVMTLRNTSVGLRDSLDTIQGVVDDIGAGGAAGFSASDVDAVTGEIHTYLTDFIDFTDNAKKVVDMVNTYRRLFLYVSFIGPAALCVIAVLGGLMNFPFLSYP